MSLAACLSWIVPGSASDPQQARLSPQGASRAAEWDSACSAGRLASPIELTDAASAEFKAVRIAYRPQDLAVLNTGHTIQVNSRPGNYIELDGERFELLEYHFHRPAGPPGGAKAAAMALRLVHRNAAGALAVLSVNMVEGRANRALDTVWMATPALPGREQHFASIRLDPGSLLPIEPGQFRYAGAITTPQCSGVEAWIEFLQPIELSAEQIRQFITLFPADARPAQGAMLRDR